MYSHLAVLNPLCGGVGPYGGGVGFQPEYSGRLVFIILNPILLFSVAIAWAFSILLICKDGFIRYDIGKLSDYLRLNWTRLPVS
jgi:hypothetical protein